MNAIPLEFIFYLIIFFGCIFTYALVIKFIRPLVFIFEKPFFFINLVVWFFSNPMRYFWKNREESFSRGVFVLITLTGISLVWWIVFYIISLPLRFLLALYYDVVLFLTTSIMDNIEEFVNPKIGKIKYKRGCQYILSYALTLPIRFIKFLFHSFFYLLDSFLMLGVSIVFPTLTLFHGTTFRKAGTKITQSGYWKVGTGNYAGTGVYFGIRQKTAKHYAPSGEDASIVMARVTLSFCKTIATLKKEERELVGSEGEELAKRVQGFYATTEHWRNSGWWEYCLLQPNKMKEFIKSWRIRPVALINDGHIIRTYGGFSHYCKGGGLVAGGLSWLVLMSVIGLF